VSRRRLAALAAALAVLAAAVPAPAVPGSAAETDPGAGTSSGTGGGTAALAAAPAVATTAGAADTGVRAGTDTGSAAAPEHVSADSGEQAAAVEAGAGPGPAPAAGTVADAVTTPALTGAASGPRTHWAIDGAVIAGAAGGALGSTLLPVRGGALWQRQLLSFDGRAEDNFSTRAHDYSNVTFGLALAAPLAFDVARGVDRDTVRRTAIYGEALAVNFLLNSGIKHAVGRPRPYLYSDSPDVQAWAAGQGNDARQSFYSGHTSTTFCAAVAGSWLYAQSSSDTTLRTIAWATSLTLAGATADLRVRAGKHFPSDVLAGAALGSAIGYAIPRLHYWGRGTRKLTTPEWVAIVLAPIAGLLLGQVLPLEKRL
jgi:membrane-associated phospholipid phosphatase